MTKTVLFTIGKGILLGAFLFFIPKFLLLIALPFLLFAFFFSRKMRSGKFRQHQLAFADKVRGMSDEDYEAFKAKAPQHYCSRGRHRSTKEETTNNA